MPIEASGGIVASKFKFEQCFFNKLVTQSSGYKSPEYASENPLNDYIYVFQNTVNNEYG